MNQLIPVDKNEVSKYSTTEDFLAVSSATFLPRLQLFGANSELVKKGKFPMAHYGVVTQKDQAEDLGPEVEIIPIAWRPKAMRLIDTPVSYFNPKSEDFMSVQKDSEQPNSNCMYGPEFLIWIPALQRFGTYFMSSKTARRQAPELRALLGCGAVLGCQLIETKQYSWHGPTVKRAVGEITNLPSEDEVDRQRKTFNNPEESTIEFDPAKLEESGSTDGERDR